MKKSIFLSILFVGVFISITSAQVKYTSSGYLGIGETTPDHAVHIKAATPTLKLESSTGNGNAIMRFTEASNFTGGFIKYDGWNNYLNFGVHNAWDSNESNDIVTMKIKRSDGQVQFGSVSNTNNINVVSYPESNGNTYAVNFNNEWTFWVDAAGTVHYNEIYTLSDETLKTEIESLQNTKELIQSLRPVQFRYKEGVFGSSKVSDKKFGLIAQEVQKVLPEIVKSRGDTLLEINYVGLIPLLLDAVKNQQVEIDELKAQISGSEAAYKSSMVQTSSDDLGELSSAALFQNVPNPFNYKTIIKYSIPAIESYAMINVYDLSGRQVKNYNLTQTGDGEIMIPASELDPGLFIYNLIVDGIEIASRRMVLTE